MDTTLTKLIQKDSLLPQHIKSFGTIPSPSDCNVILLTGATGNLGPYLLKNLLERPILKVYCLVRKTAFERAESILRNLRGNLDVDNRVVLITGDLSTEKFGIESKYEELAFEVDAVIHSAVKSHHLEMYQKNVDKTNDLRTVNVLGTVKILEFATTNKLKRIFHASSILGCNRLSESEITLSEELIEDDNNGDGLGMGYAISKFICDKLMSQAIRRGIPVFVCRFPLIVFDRQTGVMDFQNNHFFYLPIAIIETGVKSEYPSAGPIVPVDLCANISIDLFFNGDVPNGIYNLMNPHKADIEEIFIQCPKIFGRLPPRMVDFQEFSKSVIAFGKNSILYPFKLIYFDKDSEEILTQLNLTTNLLLTYKGGKYLQNVSRKFRKYVPDVNSLIDPPLDLALKMLQLGKQAGYSPNDLQSG